jgi:serine/threonine protein kinase
MFRSQNQQLCVHRNVVQLEVIGHGHYGQVYKAMWRGKPVAVKKLWQRNYKPEEYTALLHETIRHHNNVHPGVPLHGMVDEPQLSAKVMPLMQHGSLIDACELYCVDPALVSGSVG